MAKYFLTNKAVEDISKIWDYTYEVWSEADKYYELLIEAFKEIEKKPAIGKKYEQMSNDIYGFGIGKHIIFYRNIAANDIEIIRVLHERMDLKNRIAE